MRDGSPDRKEHEQAAEKSTAGDDLSLPVAARRSRQEQLAEVQTAFEEWQQRTVDQRTAAAMLGVTKTKLRRWLLAGRGPRPFRDGDDTDGRVRFDVREISAYLANPAGYEAAKSRS